MLVAEIPYLLAAVDCCGFSRMGEALGEKVTQKSCGGYITSTVGSSATQANRFDAHPHQFIVLLIVKIHPI